MAGPSVGLGWWVANADAGARSAGWAACSISATRVAVAGAREAGTALAALAALAALMCLRLQVFRFRADLPF